MTSPPFPLTSWLPVIAPSSTTHFPPDLCLLAALWPDFALTLQPLSVLPSKRLTNPFSSDDAGLSLSAWAGGRSASTAARGNRSRGMRCMGLPPGETDGHCCQDRNRDEQWPGGGRLQVG